MMPRRWETQGTRQCRAWQWKHLTLTWLDEFTVTDDSEVSWLMEEKEGKRREEEGGKSVKGEMI